MHGPEETEFKRRERYRNMAVRIRLTRMGAKKKPFYRIVASDSQAPRDGKFIEILGYYDPTKNPAVIEVKAEKVTYWLNQGAGMSESARSLLSKKGLLKSQPATG